MADMRRCNQCGHLLPSHVPDGTGPACMPRTGPQPETTPLSDGSTDENLTFSFEPAQPGHILESLARSIGSIPRVLLPETGADETSLAITDPSSDTIPAPAERADRTSSSARSARRDGGNPPGPRPRTGPRAGRQSVAGGHRGQARAGPPVCRGGADWRPASAPWVIPVYEFGSATAGPYSP